METLKFKSKKEEFIYKGMKITRILAANDIVRPSRKGEHCGNFIGFTVWPGIKRHWEIVWRRFGNIYNYIILYRQEEIRSILSDIDFVKIEPTRSNRFCRLSILFY